MEKISQIVRGNSRVAAVDLKGSSAVRPGAPSFGRPMGVSTQAMDSAPTTAARAINVQQELTANKKAGPDRVVQDMADQFFMSKIRANEEVVTAKPIVMVADEIEAPVGEVEFSGFTPRGSYVDLRA